MLKLIACLVVLSPLVGALQAAPKPMTYPDRAYAAGLLCFERGDHLGAKSAWTKYRAYCRLDLTACRLEDLRKVDTFFTSLTPAAPPQEIPAEPQPVLPQKEIRQKTEKPAKKKADAPVKKADSAGLVREAERARERGQLEYALRLYQLAEKVNLETEEFGEQIAELKKLIE